LNVYRQGIEEEVHQGMQRDEKEIDESFPFATPSPLMSEAEDEDGDDE
jgi:hypothetical protein